MEGLHQTRSRTLARQQGFTLVELMVVVVIIGILAGIGVKQYGTAQDRSRNTGMISLVRAVQLGIENWKADYRGLPVDLVSDGGGSPPSGADAVDNSAPWKSFLAAADDKQGGVWPVKYTPGGYLPKTPWCQTYQHSMDSGTPYNSNAVSNGDVGDKWPLVMDGTVSLDSCQVQGQAGVWSDGQEGQFGKSPDVNTGPTSRSDYGYIAYGQDAKAGRYLILGVGKIGSHPWIIAARSNQ